MNPCTPVPATWRIIPGLGYVVNNHGDRFRPHSWGCGTPSKMASKWGVDTKVLGLQVLGFYGL